MKYYLTTAIPYVNAKPHVGHALEYVIADVIKRYQKSIGKRVVLASGADENAVKNVQAAEAVGMDPTKFLDKHSKIFEDFFSLLEVELDSFRRGTDEKLHWPGVQKLWAMTNKNGDIYKKEYRGKYCGGCESFKVEKELENGRCPLHSNRELEVVAEENYFFKLSRYQEKLKILIESDELKIRPSKIKKEILAFIDSGLEDFSVSRSTKRARGIGVPVPGDKTQKIYVWFDALSIYMTAIGWGYDGKKYTSMWPADLHIIGKDIIRFHALYWPAMLMSAKLPLPKNLLVHGFINSGGKKMSKSLGNVVDPYEMIEKYGVEAVRYYLISQIPTLDDGDFTSERMGEVYRSDLVNELGNLVQRVASLAMRAGVKNRSSRKLSYTSLQKKWFEEFKLNLVIQDVWKQLRKLDAFLNREEPWKQTGERKAKTITQAIEELKLASYRIQPFMPRTAQKIDQVFADLDIQAPTTPLFPKIA